MFVSVYFIPASPTETRFPLEKRLKNFKPEFLLMAEQLNGKEYENTIDFLINNDYEVITFELSVDEIDDIWGRWNKENKAEILEQRAVEIQKQFKEFILERAGK